jgi:hypothetical protein
MDKKLEHIALWIRVLAYCAIVLSTARAEASEPVKLSDETIRSQIAGAWVGSETFDGQPMILSVDYRADGTLAASAQIVAGRYRTKWVLTGTWHVRNGYLICHTEVTGSPPRNTVQEVVGLNDKVIILRDGDGDLVVKRRAPVETMTNSR